MESETENWAEDVNRNKTQTEMVDVVRLAETGAGAALICQHLAQLLAFNQWRSGTAVARLLGCLKGDLERVTTD